MSREPTTRPTALLLALAALTTIGGFARASSHSGPHAALAPSATVGAAPASRARVASSPCTTNADCVPNAPCVATRCVNPRQRTTSAGCPDVVETMRLQCSCTRGRCVGRQVPVAGAGL